jgi:hypothetical protein
MRTRRFDADAGIPTLALALSDHLTIADLKPLVALTGEVPPARKADLAAAVLRHLEGARLETVWRGLDELQRAAVAEVVHSTSTRFDAGRFFAKYGREPNWGSAGEYGRGRKPSPLCFFFYRNGVMPDDLKVRLRAFVPAPPEPSIKSLEQLPAVYERPFERWNTRTAKREHGIESIPLMVRETERSAQRELLSLLRLVDAGKVGVSDKTRKASAATLDAIAAVLDGGDYYPFVPPKDKWHDENAGPIRSFAWPLLIQAGGLAQLSGSRLQLTRAGRQALGEPAAQTLKRLWEKWTETTLLDELSRIECVKGQTGKGKHGLTAVSSRRQAIATALSQCPAQRWIAPDELLRFMRASGEEFAVSRNPWHLYIGELQYGSLGYDRRHEILDLRYLLCLLFEYMATLGLIDLALIPPAGAREDYGDLCGTDELPFFSRYDGLMFFRITRLGAHCLGIAEGYAPTPVEAKPVLRVRPDRQITVVGTELEPGDRLALDAYAVGTAAGGWRLDAAKLLAAVEAGRSIDEIRDFLAARADAPLPAAVARMLDDVAQRCARVHDRGLARLIECADEALAALIAEDPLTRKHCMRTGRRHLVVPVSSEAAFLRGLREIGYLLAAEGARVSTGRRTSGPTDSARPSPIRSTWVRRAGGG